MVLLKGVNDDKYVVRFLNEELLRIRVRPYYIFHPKKVTGTSHFYVPIEKGMSIIDHLRGNTSGMAIPAYIINAPGGLGKTPILPAYIEKKSEGHYTLRTWEGNVVEYSG
jgi:lysine 2,3-aminomutase